MSKPNGMMKRLTQLGLILMMGVSMNADAGFLGFGRDSWKEEVLLHDGQKIIVKRSQSYGGRGEIGQGSPIKEYSLAFTLPDTNKKIEWKGEYSEDVGRANLHPLALHVLDSTPYIVSEPNLCLAYNKWGRPNPPYVIFKYDSNEWQRINMQELPVEFKDINLVNNTKDHADQLMSASVVSADAVKSFNSSLTQPEYHSILREAMAPKKIVGSSANCIELVLYKGSWIMPNDPAMHMLLDHKAK